MNAVDIILIILLAALTAAAVTAVVIRRLKRKGCPGCCEGCAFRNNCGSGKADNE